MSGTANGSKNPLAALAAAISPGLARRGAPRGCEVSRSGGLVTVSKRCSVDGRLHAVVVSERSWDAFVSAVPIQEAFPDLDAGDREFLLSGTTPAEWDEIFGEEA